MGWMMAHNLRLIPDDSFCWWSSLVLVSGYTSLLGGVTLTPKASVCNLGVLLDPGCSWKNHMMAMT